MRRVLITGGAGFLGSHVIRLLAKRNATIGALVRPSTDLWRLRPLPAHVLPLAADLRDPEALRRLLLDFRPEVVIHLAWSGVGNRFRNDLSQISDNLPPTLDLIRLAAEAGCQTWIGAGSQAEYGPLNRKTTEEDLPRPTTLYGAAKLATSVLAGQLCAALGLRFAWLRVFSTYGPMEDENWMIPQLIRQLLRGEKPALTPGGQNWDYLFGPDAAEAVCRVAEEPGARGLFNLGSGQARTLKTIVEAVRDQINPALPLGFGEVPYRPDQVMHLEADVSRLRAATGWSPATSLEEGLRQTVAWHREQLARPNQEKAAA